MDASIGIALYIIFPTSGHAVLRYILFKGPFSLEDKMSDKKASKHVKIGVKIGGGPPPGYLWNVELHDRVYAEAVSFLMKISMNTWRNRFANWQDRKIQPAQTQSKSSRW